VEVRFEAVLDGEHPCCRRLGRPRRPTRCGGEAGAASQGTLADPVGASRVRRARGRGSRTAAAAAATAATAATDTNAADPAAAVAPPACNALGKKPLDGRRVIVGRRRCRHLFLRGRFGARAQVHGDAAHTKRSTVKQHAIRPPRPVRCGHQNGGDSHRTRKWRDAHAAGMPKSDQAAGMPHSDHAAERERATRCTCGHEPTRGCPLGWLLAMWRMADEERRLSDAPSQAIVGARRMARPFCVAPAWDKRTPASHTWRGVPADAAAAAAAPAAAVGAGAVGWPTLG